MGIALNVTDLAALITEQKNGNRSIAFIPCISHVILFPFNANTGHEEAAREFVKFSLGGILCRSQT